MLSSHRWRLWQVQGQDCASKSCCHGNTAYGQSPLKWIPLTAHASKSYLIKRDLFIKKKKKRKETVFQQDQEQNAKAGYWNLGKRKSKRKAASGCQEVTNKDLFYLQGVGDVWRSARRESSLQGHFVSEMILPQFDSLAQAQQNDFIWLVDTPFPWQVLIWQIFFSDNTRKKMVSERLYRSHICPKMKSQPIKTSSQSWGHQNATAFSH